MKKYMFFRIGLFIAFSMTIFLSYGQYARITYPINRTVFQQSPSGTTPISLSFQIDRLIFTQQTGLSGGIPVYKVEKVDLKTGQNILSTPRNWTVLSNSWNLPAVDLGGYIINDLSLDKGWYRISLGVYFSDPSAQFISSLTSSYFGVGDVYFVAGQSNASGFDENEDNVQNFGQTYSSLEQHEAIVYRENNYLTDDFGNRYGNNNVLGLPFYKNKSFTTLTNDDNSKIYPNGRGSWYWSQFAHNMARTSDASNSRGKDTPVMIFNIATPDKPVADWGAFNRSANDWANNELNLNKQLRRMLQSYGNILGAKAVLWHQGENDTRNYRTFLDPNAPASWKDSRYSPNYTDKFEEFLDNTVKYSKQDFNNNLPWFISKFSYHSAGDWWHNFSDPLIENLACSNQENLDSGISKKITSAAIKQKQQNVVNSATTNKKFIGVESDIITECDRATKLRVHFTGATNSLKDMGDKWYDAVNANYDNATPIIGKLLLPISVEKDGFGNYKLTGPVKSNGGDYAKYFWVKNGDGIYDASKILSTSKVYTVPNSNSNFSSPEFYICYVSEDVDVNSFKLQVCQPFVVRNNDDQQKSLRVNNSSSASLNFGMNPEQKSVSVSSSNVIWDAVDKPSWINLNTTTGGFGNTQLNISTNQANTTGSPRSATLRVKEYGTSNNYEKTITITQSTTSGCTQTDLSSLTPSSETFSYTGKRNNLNISGQTMMVGGYTSNNGIGVHANSTLVYPLNGQYNTFSGSVGRDDASDNCGCGTMKLQFVIKADGATLFTSNMLGTADGRQAFSVNVAGKNNLELIVNDGGDNTWGDHADWLDAILYCGTPPTCTTAPPAPTNVTSSPQTISSGGSSTLSATCATGVVVWNNGTTANSITVSPTNTTSYNAKCVSGSCPASNTVSVGVTVNSGACSGISNNLVMGTWNVNGQQLVARFFHGQYWLTQRAGTNPDMFVVRGSGMLQRSDVSLTSGSYYNMVGCFAWTYSETNSLQNPPTSIFPTPAGYSLSYSEGGTMIYTANLGGGGSTGCTDTYVSNNWASATLGYGSSPQIGKRFDGGDMIIGGITYTQGIGTHAASEIVYNLGNHAYANFKAEVGRDANVNNCGTCGTGQTIVFKVYNQTTGQLIGNSTNNPVTKGVNQGATGMVVPIAGISAIRLVVEDGGDQNWGDHANWAKARFTCAGSNFREVPAPTEEWFWVSPNPNDGKFIAKVNLKTPQSVQLYLSDIKGNIIKEYTFVGVEGMNNFEINIQDKVSIESIYNIRCQAGEASDSKRVIIEK